MKRAAIGTSIVLLLLPVLFLGAFAGGFGGALATKAMPVSATIPPEYQSLYVEAATAFQIPSAVLGAIGKVECDHGRNSNCQKPNAAGAEGPMQFLPDTFSRYAHASGSVLPSPYNPRDAVFAAAAKLAADNVNASPWAAIYSYNHDDGYVATVVSWAISYGWAADAETVQQSVLLHPRIVLQANATADVRLGRVDERVLAVLLIIATTHSLDDVGPFVTGHDYYVEGTDRVSNHAPGRAVDIAQLSPNEWCNG